MFCKYLSFDDCDSRKLATFHEYGKQEYLSSDTVCLSTCHRVEFYSDKPITLKPPPEFLGCEWNSISGLETVLNRLASIASGAESKILGEQFVSFQVVRPFLRTKISNLPFDLIDGAFEIGSRVKARYNFITSFSYDDAAFKLFDARPDEFWKRSLVIIGGGLLGQQIASHVLSREYERVIIITKQIDRCKSDIDSQGGMNNVEVVTIENADIPESFDTVFATTSHDKLYKQKVIDMLRSRVDGSIVDLCAVPIETPELHEKGSYTCMYDEDFLRLVKISNQLLNHTRDVVTRSIRSEIKALMRNG